MGAVADFVGDVVGGVVEAVGDVVEAVGDVVSDAADWIGDNVVQPILDDPVTFIAGAVAFSMGIPGLAFAGPGTAASVGIATTGSRLAQGDDFDDAVKAGALAFAGTGVTNALGAGYTSGGKDFSPNLYSTADEIAAANAAKAAAPSAIQQGATGPSGDDLLLKNVADADALARDIYPDFQDLASTGDDQLVRKSTTDPFASQKDAFGVRADDLLDLDDAAARSAARGTAQTDPLGFQRSAFGVDDTIDYTKDAGGYKSSISASADDVAPGGGSSKTLPPIEDRYSSWDIESRADPSLVKNFTELGKAGLETVGDWIWDGAKWVWDNPTSALALGALGSSLLGRKNGPDDNKTIIDRFEDDKTARDEVFNKDLEQLKIDRDKQLLEALEGGSKADSTFGRGKNPYESDIYRYGETRGEHAFYSPTTYQPVEYAAPVTAAQGGSIGALNAQMPSYYRYGAMPMAMGGYASGGLQSLKHDGRSDHIPAMLSDGEYVIDAETVALLGNGSNEAGANRLEGMRQEVRKQKGKALAKGKFSSNAKSPLAYIKQRRG